MAPVKTEAAAAALLVPNNVEVAAGVEALGPNNEGTGANDPNMVPDDVVDAVVDVPKSVGALAAEKGVAEVVAEVANGEDDLLPPKRGGAVVAVDVLPKREGIVVGGPPKREGTVDAAVVVEEEPNKGGATAPLPPNKEEEVVPTPDPKSEEPAVVVAMVEPKREIGALVEVAAKRDGEVEEEALAPNKEVDAVLPPKSDGVAVVVEEPNRDVPEELKGAVAVPLPNTG